MDDGKTPTKTPRPAAAATQTTARLARDPAAMRRMFDTVARLYDAANHVFSGGLDHRWRSRAAGACRLADGATALDLCCGTGDLTLAMFRSAGRGLRVVAADVSREMLGRARTKLVRARLSGRVAMLEAEATRLPLADASIDAAGCAFGIRNLADPSAGLAEMVRVVRPAGRVVVLEFYRPSGRGWTGSALALYFQRILPTLGERFLARGAYPYLARSIDAFGPIGGVADRMRAAGLVEVRPEPLPGGIAAVYAGTRPARPEQVGRA